SRQFIVQWNKIEPILFSDTVTFEVSLFETSNRILCSYLDTIVSDDSTNAPVSSRGVSATVGIRDTSGQTNNRNLQWSSNQAVIANGLDLIFALPDHPPIASDDVASTLEDVPDAIAVVTNDSDADADSLSVVPVTQGANGVVPVNANGPVTYSPAANF